MAHSILHDCKLCGNKFKRSRPDQNSQNYCSIKCRILSKLDMSGGEESCWNWIAKSRHKFGYGLVNINGFVTTSHRAIWEAINGEINNKDLFVCHHCDNPSCCNPIHLFLGSPADNQHDMVAKGRHATKGKNLPEQWKINLRKPKIIKNPRTSERLREICLKSWETRRAKSLADMMRKGT